MSSTVQIWEKLVQECPESPVVISPDGNVVDRRSLDVASSRLAATWAEAGMRPRRIIAMNLSNGVGWITGFLACLKLEAIAVPLDPKLKAEIIDHLISKLRVQGHWNGSYLREMNIGNARYFRKTDLVLGKVTSGSTGQPKILFFGDEEMQADARNIIETMGIRSEDLNLGVIPWGHSYGLGNIIFPLLINGVRATWTESPFPAEIAEVCHRTKATVFPAVPTFLRAMARSEINPSSLSSLRLVISAGARLPSEVARAFHSRFQIRPHNFYGSSETGGICYDPDGGASLEGRGVGKPLDGVRLRPARGHRFYVESRAVFRFGNRHRSERGEGRHLTADLGYLDHAGYLILERRSKGMLKIGGRRIDSSELEGRLESIPGICQAIVLELEHKGEAALAIAVETSTSSKQVYRQVQEKIPYGFRPKYFACLPSFPVTERGKLDLSKIKRQLLNLPDAL